MEKVMIEQLLVQSVFAGLFIWLFIDTRKDNKAREQKYQEREDKYQEAIKDCSNRETKYQETIKELSYVLHDAVKEVKDDVADIKNKLEKKE